MGYNVHITRGNWWEHRPGEITYQEWRAVAEADPEFEKCGESFHRDVELIEDDAEVPPRSGVAREYDCYALAAHPDYPSFDYSQGTVRVRGGLIDEAVLRKMLQVARKLGAVVQGDEGEVYRLTERGIGWHRDEADEGA